MRRSPPTPALVPGRRLAGDRYRFHAVIVPGGQRADGDDIGKGVAPGFAGMAARLSNRPAPQAQRPAPSSSA